MSNTSLSVSILNGQIKAAGFRRELPSGLQFVFFVKFNQVGVYIILFAYVSGVAQFITHMIHHYGDIFP